MAFFKGEEAIPEKSRFQSFRDVLTADETGVPGLSVFGHAADARPILPILEHQHSNKFEFILVLRGIRRISAGGETYTLYQSQAFASRPNESHASPEEQPSAAELLWFQLDLSERDFLGLPSWEAKELRLFLSDFRGRVLELSPALLAAFADCFRLLARSGAVNRVEGRSLFVCCLVRLLSCKAPREQPTPEIDRAKQYILLHVKEAIDMDELLLASGLSIGDFRREFEAQMGCSPREYINRQKVDRAKRAVTRGKKTIADIAYEYHFSSPSFFKLQFKKQTGMSPAKYRRKQKSGSK